MSRPTATILESENDFLLSLENLVDFAVPVVNGEWKSGVTVAAILFMKGGDPTYVLLRRGERIPNEIIEYLVNDRRPSEADVFIKYNQGLDARPSDIPPLERPQVAPRVSDNAFANSSRSAARSVAQAERDAALARQIQEEADEASGFDPDAANEALIRQLLQEQNAQAVRDSEKRVRELTTDDRDRAAKRRHIDEDEEQMSRRLIATELAERLGRPDIVPMLMSNPDLIGMLEMADDETAEAILLSFQPTTVPASSSSSSSSATQPRGPVVKSESRRVDSPAAQSVMSSSASSRPIGVTAPSSNIRAVKPEYVNLENDNVLLRMPLRPEGTSLGLVPQPVGVPSPAGQVHGVPVSGSNVRHHPNVDRQLRLWLQHREEMLAKPVPRAGLYNPNVQSVFFPSVQELDRNGNPVGDPHLLILGLPSITFNIETYRTLATELGISHAKPDGSGGRTAGDFKAIIGQTLNNILLDYNKIKPPPRGPPKP